MNSESYKIVISLSHHRIAYEYWQRDGEDRLVAMPDGEWPAPMAFYCSDSGIVVGEDAERAAHSGTENAFTGYFEHLTEDRNYTIGGQPRPIRNLILDASEMIFRSFFRNVLFDRFGSLSYNRAGMPLTLVCEADVKPNERAHLCGLFRDSGYTRVQVVDYDRYIDRYIRESLARDYVCDKVLVAWTEGTDLTFTLYDVAGKEAPIGKTYEGLGIDPRKEYVVNLIWERVVGQNPWLTRDAEEGAIRKVASDFLCSSVPMVKDTIILSDGQKYHYSLNRNSIDFIHNNEGVAIREKLEEFLKENGVANRSRVLLLLRGMAAGNSYFEMNLSHGFSKTIKSDKKLRDNTMKLLLSEPPSEPVSTPPPPSPPTNEALEEKKRKWRTVKAEAKGKHRGGQTAAAIQMLKDFFSECESVPGVESLLAEIRDVIDSFGPVTPPPPPPSGDDLKKLERKWREVKAMAKGKDRAGNTSEAIDILKAFAKEVGRTDSAGQLMDSINLELTALTKKLSGGNALGGKGADGDSGGRPGGNRARSNGGNDREKDSASTTSTTEEEEAGRKLLKDGKLKEAREWYRAHNDNVMARTLTDIIRSSKGMDHRKAGLEECRRSKNKEQIARIINEIQDFIELCKKAGIDSSDYKKLLLEYRKI